MKKTILTAVAALCVAIPAANAQKVNESGLLAKLAKSDSEIADAKKGAKSSTWVNRGKLFYEIAAEPTKNLFVGLDAAMLKISVGEPVSTGTAEANGVAYETWEYPYMTVFIKDGKVATWKQTKFIIEDAPAKAVEAFNHAYEMDPKTESKVKDGLKQISDFCSQVGNAGLDSGEFLAASEAYEQAFKAQSSPAYGQADPILLYYAGYLRTVDGATHPESFKIGGELLQKALEMNYNDEDGNIYYYLFHCLYGQKDADKANVMKAKEALLKGIEKYPKNERILDGLMQLYTSEEGVGDPADLIGLMDKAIAENPENIDLWFGRGRIFYALKNYDESINSFKKVVELNPELYEGNYFLGVFYAVKAEEMLKEINEKPYSSQEAYDVDRKVVNAVYMESIPWFEKAYELKPESIDALEMLKQICFSLRDEEGMMDKYTKYNALFQQAKGN